MALVIVAFGSFFWGRATAPNQLAVLPKPELAEGERGQLGIDKNVNESTIDKYLGRKDAVYRDVRMLEDPGNYAAIGGDSYLSGFVDGFEVVPLPYIVNVAGLPEAVGDTYKGKTLLVIVDYKTGSQDLNLSNCYYGLNLQLPVYLYLSKKGDLKNSEVVGFYLQKILTPIPKIDTKKDYSLQKEDNLRLQGYSLYDEELLNEFDSTYENSRVVKSLSKT